MSKLAQDIILRPIITENSMDGIADRKYTFEVAKDANKVEIKNTKTNAKMSYTIVSENEANLKEFKISTTTPIAKALLGKKVGDIVEVVTPAAKMSFEILSISI
jgi:transcription elongation factor GreA